MHGHGLEQRPEVVRWLFRRQFLPRGGGIDLGFGCLRQCLGAGDDHDVAAGFLVKQLKFGGVQLDGCTDRFLRLDITQRTGNTVNANGDAAWARRARGCGVMGWRG